MCAHSDVCVCVCIVCGMRLVDLRFFAYVFNVYNRLSVVYVAFVTLARLLIMFASNVQMHISTAGRFSKEFLFMEKHGPIAQHSQCSKGIVCVRLLSVFFSSSSSSSLLYEGEFVIVVLLQALLFVICRCCFFLVGFQTVGKSWKMPIITSNKRPHIACSWLCESIDFGLVFALCMSFHFTVLFSFYSVSFSFFRSLHLAVGVDYFLAIFSRSTISYTCVCFWSRSLCVSHSSFFLRSLKFVLFFIVTSFASFILHHLADYTWFVQQFW